MITVGSNPTSSAPLIFRHLRSVRRLGENKDANDSGVIRRCPRLFCLMPGRVSMRLVLMFRIAPVYMA